MVGLNFSVSILLILCFVELDIIEAKESGNSESSDQCRDLDPSIIHLLSNDPYLVLGVPREAEISVVKKNYRSLAKIWHPDKYPFLGLSSSCGKDSASEVIISIGNAYNILSDPELKDIYDRLGVSGLQRLQDGDPRVKKGYLPPDEVLRRYISRDDPPISGLDWLITSIFAWVEGKPSYSSE